MGNIVTLGNYEMKITHNGITGGISMVNNEPRDAWFIVFVMLQCLLQVCLAAMKAQGNHVTVNPAVPQGSTDGNTNT